MKTIFKTKMYNVIRNYLIHYKYKLYTILIGCLPYHFVKYAWFRRLVWFETFFDYNAYHTNKLNNQLRECHHYPYALDLHEYYELEETGV